MAGCGCSEHLNRRHIADGQAADVNVGCGASISDGPMPAVSLDLPLDAHARMTGVGRKRTLCEWSQRTKLTLFLSPPFSICLPCSRIAFRCC
jgi:hypothetical protein